MPSPQETRYLVVLSPPSAQRDFTSCLLPLPMSRQDGPPHSITDTISSNSAHICKSVLDSLSLLCPTEFKTGKPTHVHRYHGFASTYWIDKERLSKNHIYLIKKKAPIPYPSVINLLLFLQNFTSIDLAQPWNSWSLMMLLLEPNTSQYALSFKCLNLSVWSLCNFKESTWKKSQKQSCILTKPWLT